VRVIIHIYVCVYIFLFIYIYPKVINTQPKFNGMSAEYTHLIEGMLVRVVIYKFMFVCIFIYIILCVCVCVMYISQSSTG